MILTVDQVRQHIVTGLPDDALLRLVEAAEGDLGYDPDGTRTQRCDGGHELLVLSRPVGTVTSVTEDVDEGGLELEEDDYRIEGYILRRLDTGTNPRTYWLGRTDVVHTPTSTSAELSQDARDLVAIVKIDLALSGYITEATQDEARAPWEYQLARKRILENRTNDAVMVQ